MLLFVDDVAGDEAWVEDTRITQNTRHDWTCLRQVCWKEVAADRYMPYDIRLLSWCWPGHFGAAIFGVVLVDVIWEDSFPCGVNLSYTSLSLPQSMCSEIYFKFMCWYEGFLHFHMSWRRTIHGIYLLSLFLVVMTSLTLHCRALLQCMQSEKKSKINIYNFFAIRQQEKYFGS